jgi:hypothetical protein
MTYNPGTLCRDLRMAFVTTGRTPKVLSFGPINYADGGEGYMKDFEKHWDIDVCVPAPAI